MLILRCSSKLRLLEGALRRGLPETLPVMLGCPVPESPSDSPPHTHTLGQYKRGPFMSPGWQSRQWAGRQSRPQGFGAAAAPCPPWCWVLPPSLLLSKVQARHKSLLLPPCSQQDLSNGSTGGLHATSFVPCCKGLERLRVRGGAWRELEGKRRG